MRKHEILSTSRRTGQRHIGQFFQKGDDIVWWSKYIPSSCTSSSNGTRKIVLSLKIKHVPWNLFWWWWCPPSGMRWFWPTYEISHFRIWQRPWCPAMIWFWYASASCKLQRWSSIAGKLESISCLGPCNTDWIGRQLWLKKGVHVFILKQWKMCNQVSLWM